MFTIVVMPMHLAPISTFPFISFTIHLFHHWMCSAIRMEHNFFYINLIVPFPIQSFSRCNLQIWWTLLVVTPSRYIGKTLHVQGHTFLGETYITVTPPLGWANYVLGLSVAVVISYIIQWQQSSFEASVPKVGPLDLCVCIATSYKSACTRIWTAEENSKLLTRLLLKIQGVVTSIYVPLVTRPWLRSKWSRESWGTWDKGQKVKRLSNWRIEGSNCMIAA